MARKKALPPSELETRPMLDAPLPRIAEAIAIVTDTEFTRVQEALANETPLSWLLNSHRYAISNNAELWEALATAGLIPFGWCDDPTRSFTARYRECPKCGRYLGYEAKSCVFCRQTLPTTVSLPLDVRHLLALAANPQGVATAEELARTLCNEALRREGIEERPHIEWKFLEASETGSFAELAQLRRECVALGPSARELLASIEALGYGVWHLRATRVGLLARAVGARTN